MVLFLFKFSVNSRGISPNPEPHPKSNIPRFQLAGIQALSLSASLPSASHSHPPPAVAPQPHRPPPTPTHQKSRHHNLSLIAARMPQIRATHRLPAPLTVTPTACISFDRLSDKAASSQLRCCPSLGGRPLPTRAPEARWRQQNSTMERLTNGGIGSRTIRLSEVWRCDIRRPREDAVSVRPRLVVVCATAG